MTLNAAFMFSDRTGPAGVREAVQGFHPRRDRLLEKSVRNGKATEEDYAGQRKTKSR